jgi:hypothetical protein
MFSYWLRPDDAVHQCKTCRGLIANCNVCFGGGLLRSAAAKRSRPTSYTADGARCPIHGHRLATKLAGCPPNCAMSVSTLPQVMPELHFE